MGKIFQPGLLIIWLGCIAIFGVFSLLGVYVIEGYYEQERLARTQTRNYAWILEANARDAFEKLDSALAELSEHFTDQDMMAPRGSANAARYVEIHRRLQARVQLIPEVDIFNIHAANGDLLYTSLPELPKVNNFDRPYFTRIRQNPALVRVFSEPLISRSTGKPSIIICRRKLFRDGRFAGTIQANLALDTFERLYRSLQLGDNGVISMRTMDEHRLVVRYPPRPDLTNQRIVEHPIQNFFARHEYQGTFKINSFADGKSRLVSFRRIGDYPYYVSVGLAEQDYLAQWKTKSVTLLLAVSIFSSVLTYFMVRLYRSQSQLQMLNESLEERVSQEVSKNLVHERLLIQQSRFAIMGEMIGNIAHQWRQPLNTLSIVIGDIKEAYQYGELNAAYLDESVTASNLQIRKMADTIDDFRDFFKPDKVKVNFCLMDEIKDSLRLISASFMNHNISVSLHEVDGEEIRAVGFPNEFSQVMLNVLNNAKDAILETGQRDGKLEITLGEEATKTWVAIRDNGGGIREDVMPKIFDPYFTTRKKGTGLGLYMSKMIMEHMDGAISVRNVADGAEFTLVLPRPVL